MARMKLEVGETKKKYENTNRDNLIRDREMDQAKKTVYQVQEEAERKLRDVESEL